MPSFTIPSILTILDEILVSNSTRALYPLEKKTFCELLQIFKENIDSDSFPELALAIDINLRLLDNSGLSPQVNHEFIDLLAQHSAFLSTHMASVPDSFRFHDLPSLLLKNTFSLFEIQQRYYPENDTLTREIEDDFLRLCNTIIETKNIVYLAQLYCHLASECPDRLASQKSTLLTSIVNEINHVVKNRHPDFQLTINDSSPDVSHAVYFSKLNDYMLAQKDSLSVCFSTAIRPIYGQSINQFVITMKHRHNLESMSRLEEHLKQISCATPPTLSSHLNFRIQRLETLRSSLKRENIENFIEPFHSEFIHEFPTLNLNLNDSLWALLYFSIHKDITDGTNTLNFIPSLLEKIRSLLAEKKGIKPEEFTLIGGIMLEIHELTQKDKVFLENVTPVCREIGDLLASSIETHPLSTHTARLLLCLFMTGFGNQDTLKILISQLTTLGSEIHRNPSKDIPSLVDLEQLIQYLVTSENESRPLKEVIASLSDKLQQLNPSLIQPAEPLGPESLSELLKNSTSNNYTLFFHCALKIIELLDTDKLTLKEKEQIITSLRSFITRFKDHPAFFEDLIEILALKLSDNHAHVIIVYEKELFKDLSHEENTRFYQLLSRAMFNRHAALQQSLSTQEGIVAKKQLLLHADASIPFLAVACITTSTINDAIKMIGLFRNEFNKITLGLQSINTEPTNGYSSDLNLLVPNEASIIRQALLQFIDLITYLREDERHILSDLVESLETLGKEVLRLSVNVPTFLLIQPMLIQVQLMLCNNRDIAHQIALLKHSHEAIVTGRRFLTSDEYDTACYRFQAIESMLEKLSFSEPQRLLIRSYSCAVRLHSNASHRRIEAIRKYQQIFLRFKETFAEFSAEEAQAQEEVLHKLHRQVTSSLSGLEQTFTKMSIPKTPGQAPKSATLETRLKLLAQAEKLIPEVRSRCIAEITQAIKENPSPISISTLAQHLKAANTLATFDPRSNHWENEAKRLEEKLVETLLNSPDNFNRNVSMNITTAITFLEHLNKTPKPYSRATESVVTTTINHLLKTPVPQTFIRMTLDYLKIGLSLQTMSWQNKCHLAKFISRLIGQKDDPQGIKLLHRADFKLVNIFITFVEEWQKRGEQQSSPETDEAIKGLFRCMTYVEHALVFAHLKKSPQRLPAEVEKAAGNFFKLHKTLVKGKNNTSFDFEALERVLLGTEAWVELNTLYSHDEITDNVFPESHENLVKLHLSLPIPTNDDAHQQDLEMNAILSKCSFGDHLSLHDACALQEFMKAFLDRQADNNIACLADTHTALWVINFHRKILTFVSTPLDPTSESPQALTYITGLFSYLSAASRYTELVNIPRFNTIREQLLETNPLFASILETISATTVTYREAYTALQANITLTNKTTPPISVSKRRRVDDLTEFLLMHPSSNRPLLLLNKQQDASGRILPLKVPLNDRLTKQIKNEIILILKAIYPEFNEELYSEINYSDEFITFLDRLIMHISTEQPPSHFLEEIPMKPSLLQENLYELYHSNTHALLVRAGLLAIHVNTTQDQASAYLCTILKHMLYCAKTIIPYRERSPFQQQWVQTTDLRFLEDYLVFLSILQRCPLNHMNSSPFKDIALEHLADIFEISRDPNICFETIVMLARQIANLLIDEYELEGYLYTLLYQLDRHARRFVDGINTYPGHREDIQMKFDTTNNLRIDLVRTLQKLASSHPAELSYMKSPNAFILNRQITSWTMKIEMDIPIKKTEISDLSETLIKVLDDKNASSVSSTRDNIIKAYITLYLYTKEVTHLILAIKFIHEIYINQEKTPEESQFQLIASVVDLCASLVYTTVFGDAGGQKSKQSIVEIKRQALKEQLYNAKLHLVTTKFRSNLTLTKQAEELLMDLKIPDKQDKEKKQTTVSSAKKNNDKKQTNARVPKSVEKSKLSRVPKSKLVQPPTYHPPVKQTETQAEPENIWKKRAEALEKARAEEQAKQRKITEAKAKAEAEAIAEAKARQQALLKQEQEKSRIEAKAKQKEEAEAKARELALQREAEVKKSQQEAARKREEHSKRRAEGKAKRKQAKAKAVLELRDSGDKAVAEMKHEFTVEVKTTPECEKKQKTEAEPIETNVGSIDQTQKHPTLPELYTPPIRTHQNTNSVDEKAFPYGPIDWNRQSNESWADIVEQDLRNPPRNESSHLHFEEAAHRGEADKQEVLRK